MAGLTAVAGAAALPGSGMLWLTARLLLDGAGALFGLYLVAALTLFLSGYAMRLRGNRAGRGQVLAGTANREAAAHEPARP